MKTVYRTKINYMLVNGMLECNTGGKLKKYHIQIQETANLVPWEKDRQLLRNTTGVVKGVHNSLLSSEFGNAYTARLPEEAAASMLINQPVVP